MPIRAQPDMQSGRARRCLPRTTACSSPLGPPPNFRPRLRRRFRRGRLRPHGTECRQRSTRGRHTLHQCLHSGRRIRPRGQRLRTSTAYRLQTEFSRHICHRDSVDTVRSGDAPGRRATAAPPLSLVSAPTTRLSAYGIGNFTSLNGGHRPPTARGPARIVLGGRGNRKARSTSRPTRSDQSRVQSGLRRRLKNRPFHETTVPRDSRFARRRIEAAAYMPAEHARLVRALSAN